MEQWQIIAAWIIGLTCYAKFLHELYHTVVYRFQARAYAIARHSITIEVSDSGGYQVVE
ncbi:MAG: hypothetical protein JO316_20720 [Abitibacteriaceae bacterium]|nr:hypothetical protein [Abditibacteriaceae bacterium]MBV9867783.1 hypothetical protein [Abditibacteriaceae bacterium]